MTTLTTLRAHLALVTAASVPKCLQLVFWLAVQNTDAYVDTWVGKRNSK